MKSKDSASIILGFINTYAARLVKGRVYTSPLVMQVTCGCAFLKKKNVAFPQIPNLKSRK